MEPNDDLQFRNLLKEWETPQTPATLESRVMKARKRWWDVLLHGYIRIPVPLACGLALLMAFGAWKAAQPSQPAPCAAESSPASGQCRPGIRC